MNRNDETTLNRLLDFFDIVDENGIDEYGTSRILQARFKTIL